MPKSCFRLDWRRSAGQAGRARDVGIIDLADRGPKVGRPPFVMIPEAIRPNGPRRSSQLAGFQGAAFDPYQTSGDLPDQLH